MRLGARRDLAGGIQLITATHRDLLTGLASGEPDARHPGPDLAKIDHILALVFGRDGNRLDGGFDHAGKVG